REEGAVMGGGSYRQVFAKVTLPLLRPAILSPLLLLFVMGMASYEVPRLIGRPARIDVFITDIQGAIIAAPPAFGVASALGLTLLGIDHSDRRCLGNRSRRRRPGREPFTTGRQRHRLVERADRPRRQEARAVTRDRPQSAAVGDPGERRPSGLRAGNGRGSGCGAQAPH